MYNSIEEKEELRDKIVKEKGWYVPAIHGPSKYIEKGEERKAK